MNKKLILDIENLLKKKRVERDKCKHPTDRFIIMGEIEGIKEVRELLEK